MKQCLLEDVVLLLCTLCLVRSKGSLRDGSEIQEGVQHCSRVVVLLLEGLEELDHWLNLNTVGVGVHLEAPPVRDCNKFVASAHDTEALVRQVLAARNRCLKFGQRIHTDEAHGRHSPRRFLFQGVHWGLFHEERCTTVGAFALNATNAAVGAIAALCLDHTGRHLSHTHRQILVAWLHMNLAGVHGHRRARVRLEVDFTHSRDPKLLARTESL
mmetsp:Transcript_19393/g.51775  ORF Transcript_19393/g.51775 Transcript_19393/m.51775 type:complete len:214 (-) Transcript_19393:16-657(-)